MELTSLQPSIIMATFSMSGVVQTIPPLSALSLPEYYRNLLYPESLKNLISLRYQMRMLRNAYRAIQMPIGRPQKIGQRRYSLINHLGEPLAFLGAGRKRIPFSQFGYICQHALDIPDCHGKVCTECCRRRPVIMRCLRTFHIFNGDRSGVEAFSFQQFFACPQCAIFRPIGMPIIFPVRHRRLSK